MDTAKSLITSLFGGSEHVRTCEICGNESNRAFEVRMNGEAHVYDSFECAIHALAPRCANCGCSILGHGVVVNTTLYCCAHCATVHTAVHEFGEGAAVEHNKA